MSCPHSSINLIFALYIRVRLSANILIISIFIYFFRLDYGLSSTDRLYEYISARMYGEHTGDCDTAYPKCPFSAFKLLDPEEIMNVIGNNIV